MKKIIDNIRSFFFTLGQKIKPKAVSANQESAPRAKGKMDRFTIVSWVLTVLIVAALLGSTILYKNSLPTAALPPSQPTSAVGAGQVDIGVPAISGNGGVVSSIPRKLQLITNIPERPRYDTVIYRVSRGDAMISIADEYKLKPETILYVNTQLEDNPHNLKPGMELTIPPVDGLYYEWKDGDTFESVAEKFETTPDQIIDFPGNNIDLTDPKVEPGTKVMIPGGSRALRQWQ